jgi:hypothetical protein
MSKLLFTYRHILARVPTFANTLVIDISIVYNIPIPLELLCKWNISVPVFKVVFILNYVCSNIVYGFAYLSLGYL